MGIGAAAVDREALRLRMDLREYNGFIEDEAVAAALRDGEARRAFLETGVAALRSTVPALRSEPGGERGLVWRLRVSLPHLDDGRLDLRIDVPPGETAAEILEEMALGNDPARRVPDLRAALAATAAQFEGSLRRVVARLREQIRDDLHETARMPRPTSPISTDRSARGSSRRLRISPASSATRSRLSARGAKVVAREETGRRRLRDRAGFGSYIDKFVPARRLNRRIIFHMGPTNSGKTYAALEVLAKAPTGTYLAPLRLLALGELRGAPGARASCRHGHRREVLGEPEPSHTARTIETADLRRAVDVAVIDEIQMLSDPDRGWAWTNALFGIPAKTVIVCGSDDALSHVRRAAEAAGEIPRRGDVRAQDTAGGAGCAHSARIRAAGDAVVAFSRRAVHEIRETIVAAGRSVATIYGALSPEVRRAEARRFRDGEAEVLVTTDAIGMGLNLGPLKRVIFSAVTKWDGTATRPLTNPEIRQIAGRADASATRTRGTSLRRTRRASDRSAMRSPAPRRPPPPIPGSMSGRI